MQQSERDSYKVEATQALAAATQELARMAELLAARELEIRQLKAQLSEFVGVASK